MNCHFCKCEIEGDIGYVKSLVLIGTKEITSLEKEMDICPNCWELMEVALATYIHKVRPLIEKDEK